ncbi:hypothetical protein RJI07_06140 [Mycoplasmatota bacterium WC30]
MKNKTLLVCILIFVFSLFGCDLSNDTTTREYYNGIPINNEDNCNDLITILIEDDLFSDTFRATPTPTLEEINEVSEIEFLRKVNDTNYYSIHRTISNIYVFHFFELDDEVMLLQGIERYSQDISFSDLEILLLNQATIEEVKVVFNDLITYDFDVMPYITWWIPLFSGDVYQLDFSLKDGHTFLKNVELYWTSEDNIYFNMLLEKDLPENLIDN